MSATIVIATRAAVEWAGRTPSDRWLDRRLEVMRSVTIPSVAVAADLVPNLRWAWLTCDQHHDRLVEESADLGFVDVVRQGSVTVPVSGPVVSVRIDSDDALDPGLYLELATRPPEVGELVEVVYGYQLRSTDMVIGRFRMRTSPPPIFAIGTTESTALDVDRYHAWGRRPRLRRKLTREGSFIQVVGHGNALNKWRAGDALLTHHEILDVERRYGISLRNTTR